VWFASIRSNSHFLMLGREIISWRWTGRGRSTGCNEQWQRLHRSAQLPAAELYDSVLLHYSLLQLLHGDSHRRSLSASVPGYHHYEQLSLGHHKVRRKLCHKTSSLFVMLMMSIDVAITIIIVTIIVKTYHCLSHSVFIPHATRMRVKLCPYLCLSRSPSSKKRSS